MTLHDDGVVRKAARQAAEALEPARRARLFREVQQRIERRRSVPLFVQVAVVAMLLLWAPREPLRDVVRAVETLRASEGSKTFEVTRATTVTALGRVIEAEHARFEVRIAAFEVEVQVFEGVVVVRPPGARLVAGQRLLWSDVPVQPADVAVPMAAAVEPVPKAPAVRTPRPRPVVAMPALEAQVSIEHDAPEEAPTPAPPATIERARALDSQGDYAEADVAYATLAAAKNGEAEIALYERGVLKLRRAGDLSGALALFDEGLERFPNGLLTPELLLSRFEVLARLKRSSDAIAAATAYLSLAPNGGRAAEVRAWLKGAAEGNNR